MGENSTATVKVPSSRELVLALALGWAAAELVGRYRHGIHPRNPAAAKAWEGRQVPRLSYSSRALRSNNDLFWLLAQRMLVLSEGLGLDDLEGKDVEGSVDQRLRALPGEIRKYIEDPASTEALEPEVFYRLLDDWTQVARLELGVRSRALRDAFAFAGELADVYWALPVPQRHNLPDWARAWNKMLYKLSMADPTRLLRCGGGWCRVGDLGGSACCAGPFPAGARRVGMGEDAFGERLAGHWGPGGSGRWSAGIGGGVVVPPAGGRLSVASRWVHRPIGEEADGDPLAIIVNSSSYMKRFRVWPYRKSFSDLTFWESCAIITTDCLWCGEVS